MPEPIDFYFDFSSPYAYLASRQIGTLAERWGRAVAWRPMMLGVAFVSVRSFAQLADQFVIGIWPFYALAVAAVFVLRRREPEAERPYRAWGYPLVPGLFLVAAVFLLGSYLVQEPLTVLANVAVLLSGVPVYLVWAARRDRG